MRIGTSARRREDPRLLGGRGRFVGDITLPRMVEVAFVRSLHAHARVTGVAVAGALGLPGVVGVLTGEDLPGLVTPYRGVLTHHPGMVAGEIWPLAREKVRYVGEPIVAVAARDRYTAEDACELVEVNYEELPAVLDPASALAPDTPLVYEELGTNCILHREFSSGDAGTALSRAAHVCSGTFQFSRHTGAPIEPRCLVADYDPFAKTLTVWISTQAPHMEQALLSQILGIPQHRIRVIAPDVGGGFGIKLHAYQDEVAACALAVRLARPVKWVSDRREGLLTDVHARDEIVQVDFGADERGMIRALRGRVRSVAGPTSVFPRTSLGEGTQVARLLSGPYRVANYASELDVIAQNKGFTGVYRSVGHPVAMAVTESMMDEIASAVGLDPVEARLRNFIAEDEMPYTMPAGFVLDAGSYARALQMMVEAADYPQLRVFQASCRSAGRLIGVGLCCFVEYTGSGPQSGYGAGGAPISAQDGTTIRIEPDGKATVLVGVTTQGQGTHTTMAQLVAEELGLDLDDVTVISGDTAVVPFGGGASGSRTAAIGGRATLLAARSLRERILQLGGSLLEASPADLELEGGQVHVKGTPDRALSLAALASIVHYRSALLPAGFEPSLEVTRHYASPKPCLFTNGVHLAVVEIDPDIGLVSILRYVVVEDCGRIINPAVVDGQVHGGVVQGLGGALYERIVYDERGQNLTTSLMDYVVPTAAEVPNIEVFHLMPTEPSSDGFRGVGESGVAGTPGAILNAVNDALRPRGARIRTQPITPERVLAALRGVRREA